jgi:type IV pilus assembly protein PilA
MLIGKLLLGKKFKVSNSKGFTLIELLAAIIIVGVLATIALPSFLNQIAKSRTSEGKLSIGAINRAQQAYRLEKSEMAGNLSLLDVKITGKFYVYAISVADSTFASVTATTTANDIKGYSGGIVQFLSGGSEVTRQVICETATPVPINTSATSPAPVEAISCQGTDRKIE